MFKLTLNFVLTVLLLAHIQAATVQQESPEDEALNFAQYLNGQSLAKNIVPSYLQRFIQNLQNLNEKDPFENISISCATHFNEFAQRLNETQIVEALLPGYEYTWSLQMIDSWGKLPEGILSGHVNAMGDFDECVGVTVKDLDYDHPDIQTEFKGKFCTVVVIPIAPTPKSKAQIQAATDPFDLIRLMSIRQGVNITPTTTVCLPSSCNNVEVAQIVRHIFNESKIFTSVATCDVKEDIVLNTGDWAMVGVLAAFGGLILVGTLLDHVLFQNPGKDSAPRKPTTVTQVLLSFSLITNIRKWQNTGGGGGFGCIHGLRFLSTMYVVLAHTWYMIIYLPWWNMVAVKTAQENWTTLTILNATLAVDTFFVMGGMLVAFNLMKMYDKTKGRLNYFMYVVHRYVRLTPTYAILVGIMATLFTYVGSGPYWAIMREWGRFCREHWWTNLLYINNLVYPTEICQAEAWYLSDDMQFYILAPFVLYPLWRWRIPGMVLLATLTVLAILAPGLQVHFQDVPPTLIGTRKMYTMYQDIYIKPWARVQTYLVGIWLGYLIYRQQGKKVHIPRPVVLFGWLVSTTVSLAVLFGIFNWYDPGYEIPDVPRFIYASLHRFAWGLCISWIIYACINGYGGYANAFLSWGPFIPLGRLSFTTYLVSLHLQMVLHVTFRQPISYNSYVMTNFFFAHVITSLLAGFVCTIAFESPFIQLEKIVFGNAAGGKPKAKSGTNPKSRNGIFYNNLETIINAPAKPEEANNNKDNDKEGKEV